MRVLIISISYGPAFENLKSNKNPKMVPLWGSEGFKQFLYPLLLREDAILCQLLLIFTSLILELNLNLNL